MTATKLTVSLDPEVVAMAREAVAQGRARSVSSFLNEAGRARAERETLGDVLADIFEATGGPLSAAERARARDLLAGHGRGSSGEGADQR